MLTANASKPNHVLRGYLPLDVPARAFMTNVFDVFNDFYPQNLNSKQVGPKAEDGIDDLLATLPFANQVLSGSAMFKADSQEFGSLTIERNRLIKWLVWVRPHDIPGRSIGFGYNGFVLHSTVPGRGIFTAPGDFHKAHQTIKKVLGDPEVMIRGNAWA